MPKYSILIPIYNEEKILQKSIDQYIGKLKKLKVNFEIILSENGSTDNTKKILFSLKNKYKKLLKILTSNEPNYGLALKKAIISSKGEYIICDELDLCDINFFKSSCLLLKSKKFDIIIGSKNHYLTQDNRPFLRRFATKVFTKILNLLFGFKGTDTHGLKAFNRKIIPYVKKVKLDKDMFATEMVIRVSNSNLSCHEIPVKLKEIRVTPILLRKRVLKVLVQIVKLFFIRIKYGL